MVSKAPTVLGWAISPTGRPADIVIRDALGRPLARGLANEERPDLACLGRGRTTFGFRVAVRRIGRADALHVSADGMEVVGSPILVGPGRFDGALSVAGDVASGWLSERVDGFAGTLVQIRDQDGALLGEAEAVPGSDNADPLCPPARFSVALDPACFGRSDLILRAFANGVRFAEARCAMRLDGYLDALSPLRCGGWLLSPDAPARTLQLQVFRDGVQVGEGTCNLPRTDVRERYPHAWRVGFDIALDPPADDGARHAYSVRLAGTDVELFDGPFVIEDRTSAIEAARRIGRRFQADAAMTPAERVLLRQMLAEFVARRRQSAERARVRLPDPSAAGSPVNGRRLAIVIPVYRDVAITQACVASVMATRDPDRDAVVLVNDRSPDEGMYALLAWYAREAGVYLLDNAENQGFVRSVNRGIAACRQGDVLLLNSDTRVFPGVFDEMCRIAGSAPDIGTVTALSNNATIFSYPHPSLPNAALSDMDWADVAAAARETSGGVAIDVPTGHGFCMLIRREALELAGGFDESFGRGYGEENDFCQRVADLGFRNVAAAGAFVEHRESVSFGGEKAALMQTNMARLGRMYPEYTPLVMSFERAEGLRRARWPLDAARLRKADAETAFALVVTNWLAGGTRKALADIEAATGYAGARKLTLSCRADGMIELEAQMPALRAVFAPNETASLFNLLSAARITHVLVHQVLGFQQDFLSGLTSWVGGRHAIYYAHDFYPLCPRVTMIDAAGQFCDVAAPDTCRRCIAAAGPHEASRLDALTPQEHRTTFGALLGAFRHVVAPSESAASYLRRIWPDLALTAALHPEPPGTPAPPPARDPASREIVLLGELGPHKGSAKLAEIARRARLSHPDLRFRVIGHTDIDAELRALGNVLITGAYEPWEQPALLAQAEGRVALFLHIWPETYSYTLSEAVAAGLFPLVPDLGAPADRVRKSGFGAVFPFPIEAGAVLRAIEAALAAPAVSSDRAAATSAAPNSAAIHRALMGMEPPQAPTPGRRSARVRPARAPAPA